MEYFMFERIVQVPISADYPYRTFDGVVERRDKSNLLQFHPSLRNGVVAASLITGEVQKWSTILAVHRLLEALDAYRTDSDMQSTDMFSIVQMLIDPRFTPNMEAFRLLQGLVAPDYFAQQHTAVRVRSGAIQVRVAGLYELQQVHVTMTCLGAWGVLPVDVRIDVFGDPLLPENHAPECQARQAFGAACLVCNMPLVESYTRQMPDGKPETRAQVAAWIKHQLFAKAFG
jgi:hypothetical protein